MSKRKGSLAFIATVLILLIIIAAGIIVIIYSRQQPEENGDNISDSLESKSNDDNNDNDAEDNTAGKPDSGTSESEFDLALPEYRDNEKELGFVDIAKKTGPAIVGIRITIPGTGSLLDSELGRPLAEGSGIIISKDGYILTNYHVVRYIDSISTLKDSILLEVYLPDGRQAEAELTGKDPLNDLAVIKISLDNLPIAELGDSSKLEVGQHVAAIGNPLGLEFAGSVTVGVISALNRVIEIEGTFLSLIQTDAAINPGNSGGALVDTKGRVIGVNSVKISVQGVEGLGFAIPVNDVRNSAVQIIKYGYVKERISVGITGMAISEIVAKLFGVPAGIFVEEVKKGSPAYNAGIEKGDILIKIEEKPIKTGKDMYLIERQHKKGDMIEAVLVRGDREITVFITF